MQSEILTETSGAKRKYEINAGVSLKHLSFRVGVMLSVPDCHPERSRRMYQQSRKATDSSPDYSGSE